ncbi:MAG: hypothetical protein ACT4PO_13255 [Actinomycetota bacterium]
MSAGMVREHATDWVVDPKLFASHSIRIGTVIEPGNTLIIFALASGYPSETDTAYTVTDTRGNFYSLDAFIPLNAGPPDFSFFAAAILSAPVRNRLQSGDLIVLGFPSLTLMAYVGVQEWRDLDTSVRRVYASATAHPIPASPSAPAKIKTASVTASSGVRGGDLVVALAGIGDMGRLAAPDAYAFREDPDTGGGAPWISRGGHSIATDTSDSAAEGRNLGIEVHTASKIPATPHTPTYDPSIDIAVFEFYWSLLIVAYRARAVWTEPRVWTVGEKVTAAKLNAELRGDLLQTTTAIVQAAGDMAVGVAANELMRLPAGSEGAFLRVGNDLVPSWSHPGIIAFTYRNAPRRQVIQFDSTARVARTPAGLPPLGDNRVGLIVSFRAPASGAVVVRGWALVGPLVPREEKIKPGEVWSQGQLQTWSLFDEVAAISGTDYEVLLAGSTAGLLHRAAAAWLLTGLVAGQLYTIRWAVRTEIPGGSGAGPSYWIYGGPYGPLVMTVSEAAA